MSVTNTIRKSKIWSVNKTREQQSPAYFFSSGGCCFLLSLRIKLISNWVFGRHNNQIRTEMRFEEMLWLNWSDSIGNFVSTSDMAFCCVLHAIFVVCNCCFCLLICADCEKYATLNVTLSLCFFVFCELNEMINSIASS